MVDTPYGQVHQTTSFPNSDTAKAPITIEYQHPLAMLYHACMHCACLSNLLGPLAASSSPSKPLSICLYTDEVLPGNPLAVTTDRKLWCWYWSVLEFGSAALSNEEIHTSAVQTCMPHGPFSCVCVQHMFIHGHVHACSLVLASHCMVVLHCMGCIPVQGHCNTRSAGHYTYIYDAAHGRWV